MRIVRHETGDCAITRSGERRLQRAFIRRLRDESGCPLRRAGRICRSHIRLQRSPANWNASGPRDPTEA